MYEQIEFNELQLKAINTLEENVVIIAPAGSGKTSTLVGAIKKYKQTNPEKSVVAITFTKKSAEDLRIKLIGMNKIHVSTIHSWAYTELTYLSERVAAKDPNKAFKVKLLQEARIKEMLKEITTRRCLPYVNIFLLYSFVMGNYNIDVSEKMKSIFKRVFNDYVDLKKRLGLYDFTDLPQYLWDKLEDYGETITGIDGLFVDEFQDVDPTQLDIFKKVKCSKRFYIGDPKQAIYIFRGATASLEGKLDDFKQYDLNINYRSYQEILDAAETCREQLENGSLKKLSKVLKSYSSKIECSRGYGGKVYSAHDFWVYEVNKPKQEINLRTLVSDLIRDDVMILCRKNKEVKALQKLGYENVSTVHQAKGLEYDNVILTDFEVEGLEDINIAYVAMTRAKNRLLLVDFGRLLETMATIQDIFVARDLF